MDTKEKEGEEELPNLEKKKKEEEVTEDKRQKKDINGEKKTIKA